MRTFAIAWPAEAIVQRPVGQLGWGQVVDLLTKVDDRAAWDGYPGRGGRRPFDLTGPMSWPVVRVS